MTVNDFSIIFAILNVAFKRYNEKYNLAKDQKEFSEFKEPSFDDIILESTRDVLGDGNFYFIDSERKVYEPIGNNRCFAVWPNLDSYQESHKEGS